MKAVALALVVVAACGIEHLPPVVLVRHGQGSAEIHRVVLLPSECASQTCKGLDAIVASELAFRGIDVVDLNRIAAVERTRTEVDISTTRTVNARPTTTSRSTRVEVQGPLLSDVDVWTMRDQLAAMGVDAVVRVRTAELQGKPRLVLALVRVTRASDASLVWASVCQVELHAVTTEARGADTALRCALEGALP
ncbi:hypothetical protein BH11MYX1_BH11MYX1_03630 [soil metagenome]